MTGRVSAADVRPTRQIEAKSAVHIRRNISNLLAQRCSFGYSKSSYVQLGRFSRAGDRQEKLDGFDFCFNYHETSSN